MSFFTSQVSFPLWLVILMVAGLAALLVSLFKLFKGRWLSVKEDVVIDSSMKTIAPVQHDEETARKPKRPNEVKILKLLAVKGEQGMLLQSIADSLQIDSNTTSRALKYLEANKMVDVINAMGGDKYFLSNVGKNYCSMKGYTSTAVQDNSSIFSVQDIKTAR
jgi:hypothetical protein